jgi:hypothetical protein
VGGFLAGEKDVAVPLREVKATKKDNKVAITPATDSAKACLASRLRSNLSVFIAFPLIIQRHHERKDLVG